MQRDEYCESETQSIAVRLWAGYLQCPCLQESSFSQAAGRGLNPDHPRKRNQTHWTMFQENPKADPHSLRERC